MGQGIFQLVIIHTQYYSSQKYCAIFAVKVVELMRSMSTYTKRRNYNVCKTNTEKKMYNHAYSMNANDLTSMSMQGHCESIQRPFRSPDSKDFLNIATTQKKKWKQNNTNNMKTFSLTKHCTELNCLELNNSDHVGAAELFCRLEGWTV